MNRTDFLEGLKKGMPIALGYIPVAFTFGLMAVEGGLPAWLAVFISMSNLTSAGQFAGTSLIIAHASLLEIAMTTFVINIRYSLMSLSLSQKISSNMPGFFRSVLAFGITDETFALASMEKKTITFPLMLGIITGPFIGWSLGTALGAAASSFLSEALRNAMGIALYAMFIAIFVPETKKSKAALVVVVLAIALSSTLTWVQFFSKISAGWRIMIATIIAASIGAVLFPKEEDYEDSADSSNLDGSCNLPS